MVTRLQSPKIIIQIISISSHLIFMIVLFKSLTERMSRKYRMVTISAAQLIAQRLKSQYGPVQLFH